MNTLDEAIKAGFDDLADQAPHNPDLAGTIRRRSRYRYAVTLAPIAAALAVLLVAAGILWLRPGQSGPAASASACTPVTTAVLPTWARTGFTDPTPSQPYVTSRSGELVAILFGPLTSPPGVDHNNKILWATSGQAPVTGPPDHGASGFDMTIIGTREGGTGQPGDTMRETVSGGPGPSIVDVPRAGCWHFELSWGNQHDSINLLYAGR